MLSTADWIAVAAVVLPIAGKGFSDIQANAIANHNAMIARITGMAGREAATIARTLATAPAGVSGKDLEKSLITNSANYILGEMSASVAKVGATDNKVQTIVQGELNKIITARPAMAPAV